MASLDDLKKLVKEARQEAVKDLKPPLGSCVRPLRIFGLNISSNHNFNKWYEAGLHNLYQEGAVMPYEINQRYKRNCAYCNFVEIRLVKL